LDDPASKRFLAGPSGYVVAALAGATLMVAAFALASAGRPDGAANPVAIEVGDCLLEGWVVDCADPHDIEVTAAATYDAPVRGSVIGSSHRNRWTPDLAGGVA
jgi:hypothetical protein